MSDQGVVIVGGGPVGLGLAITLGQSGVATTLIERNTAPQPIPRGQNLTQRTLEHCHFWGCEKELRAARTIPREHGIGGLTAYRTLLGPDSYDWMQRELVRPFYYTDNERLPQYATEAVLRARVAQLPTVTCHYGWTVGQVSDEGEGVTVTIAEREGSGRLALRGAYAVGCDGSRSIVRQAAGIEQDLSDHDRVMCLLVFRSKGLHAHLLRRHPKKSFFCVLDPALKGYWKFFGRVDLDGEFFFHAPVPLSAKTGGYDFAGLVREAAGADVDVDFTYTGFWDLRFAVAKTYRAGRLFIAGDAAHSHPPYGGYGINLGFEDAVNLGWKLAAIHQGWAGPSLLDSYDAERRPVFVSAARDFIAKSIEDDRAFLSACDPQQDRMLFDAAWAARRSGATGEVHAFEPHYEGSPIVFGPKGAETSAKGRHEHKARAGHHLSPQTLADGASTFQSLGEGFTLFDFTHDGAGKDIARAARTKGVPLRYVASPDDPASKAYGARILLVRPDQFVAWAGDTATIAPAAIVARTIGELS
ncbi:FAD-dependent monooxygenase [Phreatobacter sp.]|uniref:FAD-dependent monooxygenase n=1 Tax=Phreatobacter sp. TaxID=1966341 RepID=UPI0022C2B3BE|nr:FAD-dependent monooxygenase [Phreatobacter sp.]MCZ8314931.1 FAD-dependent monooxygenase [Phreatobacter sp.]